MELLDSLLKAPVELDWDEDPDPYHLMKDVTPEKEKTANGANDAGDSRLGLPTAGSHQLAWRTYWITSSAVARRVSAMLRPNALAVVRLITSSNLVANWTGKPLGLSPLRMPST